MKGITKNQRGAIPPKSKTVSVIVPVYNVEKYIGKCIESIVSQTYSSIQLILVDDGSIDDSGRICDNYAKKHSNISVYHKRNEGVSEARNYGMQKADGKYICFVDSDDTFADNRTLELNLLEMSHNPDLDFVQFPMMRYDDNGPIDKQDLADRTYKSCNEIFSAIFCHGTMHGFVWGKIFKTESLKKCKFRKGYSLGEDALFFLDNIDSFRNAKSCNKGLYGYYQRANSGSRTWTETTAHQYFMMWNQWFLLAQRFQSMPEYLTEFWVKRFRSFIDWSILSQQTDKKYLNDVTQKLSHPVDTGRLNSKESLFFRTSQMFGFKRFAVLYILVVKFRQKYAHAK